jgi:hypothetical protein
VRMESADREARIRRVSAQLQRVERLTVQANRLTAAPVGVR